MIQRATRAALLAVLLVIAAASPAAAHASLESTTPVAWDKLTGDEVTLQFNEGVRPVREGFRLYDSKGRPASVDARTGSTRDQVVVEIGSDRADDWYTLSWRVISDDSHPVAGTLTFSIGDPAGPAPTTTAVPQAAAASPVVGWTYGALRAVMLIALLAFTGAVGAFVLVWPQAWDNRRARLWVWAWWVVAIVTTVLSVGAQGAYTEARSLDALWDPRVIGEVLAQKYGMLALARAGVLVLGGMIVASIRPRSRPSVAAVSGWLAVGASAWFTVSLSGHASQGRWAPAALAADLVHLLVASLWLGGLAALVWTVLRRDSTTEPFAVMKRFSLTAAVSVAVLVATGVFASVRQTAGLQSILESDFGNALMIKVTLVAGVLVFAVLSRRALLAGSDTGSTDERLRDLRRSTGAELLVGIAVVAVSAWLMNTQPAREVSAAGGDPVVTTLSGGNLRVDVILDPARVGGNGLHLTALSATGLPKRTDEITARLTLGDLEVTPDLVEAGPGHVIASSLVLPQAGDWELAVRVVTEDIDVTILKGTLHVRGR